MKKSLWLASAIGLFGGFFNVLSASDSGVYPNVIEGKLGFGIPLSSLDLSDMGGSTSKVGGIGVSGMAGYCRILTPIWSVGAEAGGFLPSEKTSSDLFQTPNTDAKLDTSSFIMLATGRADIPLPADYKIQPYLFGGIGFHNTNFTLKVVQGLEAEVIDSTSLGFAAAVGAGVDYPLTDRFFVGAEVRYQYLQGLSYDTVSIIHDNTIWKSSTVGDSNVSILAHTGFKF